MTDITPRKMDEESLKEAVRAIDDMTLKERMRAHISWMDRELNRAMDIIESKDHMLDTMTNRAIDNARDCDEANAAAMEWRTACLQAQAELEEIKQKEGIRARIANAFRR